MKNGECKRYVWISGSLYVREWLQRSEREKAVVDIIDKFTCLWIAFNGWMKDKFGEELHDRKLLNKAKTYKNLKSVYNKLLKYDSYFKSNIEQMKYVRVVNMRNINDMNKDKVFDGSYESYLEIIYQTRCNLFHGRKDTTPSTKDHELIKFAYNTLNPLLKQYLDNIDYFNSV